LKFWGVRLASVAIAVGGCLALDALALTQSSFTQRLILLAGLYVTLAVSLNLINGITGQFSIGHAAFYQVGAYTTGYLAIVYYQQTNMPPGLWLFLAMLAGAAMAAIAGVVVGLPSLRLRGDYLAIVTLGFGEIIRIIVQNQDFFGRSAGTNVEPRFQYIWIVWLLAVSCIAVCRNLLKTAHGLPYLAVREDEVASSAMGVNVTKVKVSAFVIGSAFAGAAGALLAHFEGFISPQMFVMDVSFIVVTMVVLGGTGSITGSVVAALLLFYLPEKMRDLGDVRLATLVGIGIALAFGVAAIKRIDLQYHGPKLKKAYGILGVIGGVVLLSIALGLLLNFIPGLQPTVEGGRLRLVVFAVTLIVLMLLRPQGIFGHHEFSWDWVKRLLGRRAPTKEISA
jgi:branched-chain amino acid transport system permease protein